MRQIAPTSLAIVVSLLVAMAPAGAPVRAAVVHPQKQILRTAPAVAAVAAVPVAAPSASPAPLAVTADATPQPTLSGTMPPATIPPTPSVPPPIMPTPVPAAVFARVITVSNLALRTSPSGTAGVITRIPHGQIAGLLAINSSGTWYKATYRGHTGYAPVSRLQKIKLVGKTLATQYARVIVVARIQQHLEVWDHGKLMIISAVTTGRPELPTPLGTTSVLRKESPHLMQSPWKWPSIYWYPPSWAWYTLLFRSGGYYLHDTSVRPENGYGIGTNVPHTDPDGVVRTGSRGCVNTPMWAVRRLYGWGVVGDRVVVVDA